jgi:methionine-R-sulfoxide reductase
VVNGLTGTTVLLAALGGYLGWTKFGRSNSSNKADVYAFAAKDEGAGTQSTEKKSSLGYSLSMTKGELEEALQGLTSFQQSVTMEGATERSFTGETTNGFSHDNKSDGVYVSALGGLPLFDSKAKFDSGTGWPSFFQPIAPDHVVEKVDRSIPFMPRVEIVDAKSGAHLGHVFEDGPRPTGKRYCMNAAAMKFLTREEFQQLQQEVKQQASKLDR